MRWLVLDSIETIEKGKLARSRSKIPFCEYSSEVLMVEMMAQTGAVLLGAETDYQKDLVFAKIESVEFNPPYGSGESIWIEATAESFRPEGAWLDGVIRGPDREIAKCRFLLMHVDGFDSQIQKPITFHEAFMQHFDVRDKIK